MALIAITLGKAEVHAVRLLSEAMKVALWSPVELVEEGDGVYDLMATKYTLRGTAGHYYQRNVELQNWMTSDLPSQLAACGVLGELLVEHPDMWMLSASQRGFDRFGAMTGKGDETFRLDMDPPPPFEFAFQPREHA